MAGGLFGLVAIIGMFSVLIAVVFGSFILGRELLLNGISMGREVFFSEDSDPTQAADEALKQETEEKLCQERRVQLNEICTVDAVNDLNILTLRECEWLRSGEGDPPFHSCASPYLGLELAAWPTSLFHPATESIPFSNRMKERCLDARIGEITIAELALCADRFSLLIGPIGQILEIREETPMYPYRGPSFD